MGQRLLQVNLAAFQEVLDLRPPQSGLMALCLRLGQWTLQLRPLSLFQSQPRESRPELSPQVLVELIAVVPVLTVLQIRKQ